MPILMKSKIHRAWITHVELDYVGSIIIDQALMEKVNLWEHEKVLLCDATNGNRWETYVISGERGSGIISVQGAGANLCEVGDCLTILAFDVYDRPNEPLSILVDNKNQFVEYLEGAQQPELT